MNDFSDTDSDAPEPAYTNGYTKLTQEAAIALLDARSQHVSAEVTRLASKVTGLEAKIDQLLAKLGGIETQVQSHAARLTTQGIFVTVAVVVADLIWRAVTHGQALPVPGVAMPGQ